MIVLLIHSVPPPPFCWGDGGGVEPTTKFSKNRRGALTGPGISEGVAGKEGATFFKGGGLHF